MCAEGWCVGTTHSGSGPNRWPSSEDDSRLAPLACFGQVKILKSRMSKSCLPGIQGELSLENPQSVTAVIRFLADSAARWHPSPYGGPISAAGVNQLFSRNLALPACTTSGAWCAQQVPHPGQTSSFEKGSILDFQPHRPPAPPSSQSRKVALDCCQRGLHRYPATYFED